jgi:hypothetical protein
VRCHHAYHLAFGIRRNEFGQNILNRFTFSLCPLPHGLHRGVIQIELKIPQRHITLPGISQCRDDGMLS